VLDGLRELAPVVAIRGNNDKGAWAERLRATEVVEAAGALLYLLHDVGDLDLDPAAAGFHAVVSGHSHRPSVDRRDGVLFLNPGASARGVSRCPSRSPCFASTERSSRRASSSFHR